MRAGRAVAAFTLVELLVITSVLVLLSAASFPALIRYYEEQKLRQAAIELQSFLLQARSLAERRDGTCTVTLTTTGASAGNAPICSRANLSALDLPQITSVRGLCLSENGSVGTACTAPNPTQVVFNSLGVLAVPQAGATSTRRLFLSGSATRVQYCLDLSLALIRVGFRNGTSGDCTFTRS